MTVKEERKRAEHTANELRMKGEIDFRRVDTVEEHGNWYLKIAISEDARNVEKKVKDITDKMSNRLENTGIEHYGEMNDPQDEFIEVCFVDRR